MEKDKDSFQIIKKNTDNLGQNFFMQENSDSFFVSKPFSQEKKRRLNDYDSNLLEEDAYKDVKFKLEYKISKIEEELKTIDTQILLLEEIQDYEQLMFFKKRKKILEEDYQYCLKVYNNKSYSTKITEFIFKSLGFKKNKEHKQISGVYKKFISKISLILPQTLVSIIEIKKSLNKLENINKNVDDLMGLNIPYGEYSDKYQQLSKYIIKANSIHSELSNMIKKRD